MAAKLLRPDARVILVYGDGSFGLHGLGVRGHGPAEDPRCRGNIIGNDAAWTQIRRGQVDLYGEARAVATGLAYTRYEKVVEAVGWFRGIGWSAPRTSARRSMRRLRAVSPHA